MQLTLEERNRRIGPAAYLTKHFGETPKDGKPLSVDGQKGYTGLLDLKTPFGRRESRVSVLFRDKQAFLLAGAAKDPKRRARFDGEFLTATRSIHRLTAKEKALAEPQALALVKAGPKTTYEALARKSPLADHAEARLRLLNHDYPKGEPKPGELLKVVR
jgi:predicted Zn-dependent protease